MPQDDLTTTGQITKTTKTILSSVSDVDWWTDTLQWVRPLHKTTNQTEEQSTKTLPKELQFHCHPFYNTVQKEFAEVNTTENLKIHCCLSNTLTLEMTCIKYVKMLPTTFSIFWPLCFQEIDSTDVKKTENNSVYISELLLQTQKLAEERAEGSIAEPATEGE